MLFSKILSINKLKPKWATVCDKIFFLLKNSTVVVKNKNKEVPIKIVYKNKSTWKFLVTRKDIVIEIVKNIETKKPFDPNLKVAASIKHAAFEAGLICYPMSGTRDGKWGDHILLAPPFIINENQIIELVNKLSISIENLK